MKNFLEEYLKQKHHETSFAERDPGPVVTISREFGCEANIISQNLAKTLNTYYRGIGQTELWEIISKEILEESAKDLQTHQDKIKHIFAFEKRSSVDDFFMSMTSRQYQSDWKIRETIKNVVHAFAVRGHSIIIGRAGAQITKDIDKALHIKLVASLNWRVNRVKAKNQLTVKDAEKKVKEMDANRQKLLALFTKDTDNNYNYHVYYNIEKLTVDMIVSDIIHLMQLKKLV